MTEFTVPFIDLQQRFEEERTELLACVERILRLGHFVLTPEVSDFEQQVQAYTGARHCVALNSGTDALMMGLHALSIGKGDEVITSPISFIASTGSIVHVGAKPVYVDVRPDQTMDPAKIEAAITPRTKAIMPVHWGGRISDMASIMTIAESNGLKVIEDAAQTMGAFDGGVHGGRFGDVGAFSAHPLKNLNALGDGGFIVTDQANIAEKVRRYRNHGLIDRDTCVEYGVNSRLDSLNAAVLSYRLGRLPSVLRRRRRNASLYRKLITAKEVFMPPVGDDETHAYVMFLTQCERRDDLQRALGDQGIQTMVYYGTPLHLQPAAKQFGYRRGDFQAAERQADRVLALPHHQHLSDDQIAYVADQINLFYGA